MIARLIFIPFFLILVVGVIHSQEDSMIHWKADKLLEWDNFRGVAPEKSRKDARSRLVLTFNATSDQEPSLTITTSATFDPNLSWVNPSEKHLSLLKHEQGHFDICEWFRRKFNMELLKLNRLTFENAEATINDVFERIMKEYNATHEAYDAETSHSRIRDKQAEWDLRIRKELAQLRPYAYSKTKLKLNPGP